MKKQLITTSGSLLRFHGPPVTPTKQHQHPHQQQRDATTVALPSPRSSVDHHRSPVPLSPPLKLHVRNTSNLVHMLVSPTLSTRSTLSSISSASSNKSGPTSSVGTDSTANSTANSPVASPKTPTISRLSSHSRTLSLPSSPMLSRRSWTNRLSISFQNLTSRRSYSPAQSPLFEALDLPQNNDYAPFESWEKSLRLYLGSQELEGIIGSNNKQFSDAQCLKAKKAIQLHVCDKLKMDIQRFDTPAEIFAFLRKLCLPVDGKALGETMVKLATNKLAFEPSIHHETQNLDDMAAVKKFNKAFRGRIWAISQVGSPMPDHAAASMYLSAVEKAFEPWRMSMLWMDLSLGVHKLESLMAMFEESNNIKLWKKKGTAAGLLCWAESVGRDWSMGSLGSLSLVDPIPELQ